MLESLSAAISAAILRALLFSLDMELSYEEFFNPLFKLRYWLIAGWVVCNFSATSFCVKLCFVINSFASRDLKIGNSARYQTATSILGDLLAIEGTSYYLKQSTIPNIHEALS